MSYERLIAASHAAALAQECGTNMLELAWACKGEFHWIDVRQSQ